MRKVIRSSLIVVAFATSSVVASQHGQLDVRIPRDHYLRQLISPAETTTANSPATTTAAQASTETAHTTTSSPTTAAASSTTQQPTTTQATPTTQASSTAVPTTTQPPSADSATSQKSTVVGTVATDSAGDLVTSVITVAASSSPTPTPSSQPDDNSSSGVGIGTIIGLSVAGGVAAIAIICFFVWKFTRKRFSDFDDNEAIKWPELSTHGGGVGDVHALPTNSTGRAGFGAENDSDLNLARAPSPGGTYAQSITTSSVGGGQDPYAVPPLPHLNPNQPYRDDPGSFGQPGFYDPYRGPVPNTFGEGLVDPGVEAIPMTQMARTRSPGPQIAYDLHGRASPSPQAGYGYGGIGERSASPALSGARSPAPHAAPYGYGP
ncbi:hypothetical protein F5141DRAFT_1120175 [Pisolithus sp. B1]|nr:hypothetical protein F5141DRAFT_1120175 [Pisolithus sp. B1]